MFLFLYKFIMRIFSSVIMTNNYYCESTWKNVEQMF